jgi:hypothetical protein
MGGPSTPAPLADDAASGRGNPNERIALATSAAAALRVEGTFIDTGIVGFV